MRLCIALAAVFLLEIAPAIAQQEEDEPGRRRDVQESDDIPGLPPLPKPLRELALPALPAPVGDKPVADKTDTPAIPPPPPPPPPVSADPVVPPKDDGAKTVSPARKTAKPVKKPPTSTVKTPVVKPDKKDPEETPSARLLREGRAFIKAKQLMTPKGRSALGRFRQVLALDPDNAEARRGISRIAEIYGKWGKAANGRKAYRKAAGYLTRAVSLNPRDPTIRALLGRALLGQGKFARALAAFRKAIAIRPRQAEYHSAAGIAQIGLKKYPAAISSLRRATSLSPNDHASWRLIGDANQALGKPKAAAGAYRRAYAIKPRPGADDLAIGRLDVKAGDFRRAVAPLKRAAKYYPNDPEPFDLLATAYRELGMPLEAIAAVKRRNLLERKRGTKQVDDGKSTASPTGIADAKAQYKAGRHATAYYGFKREAEKGNAEAAYLAGRMRHEGKRIQKDMKKAFDWYMKAARAGHPAAQAGVGFMYYRGLGGARRDRAEAARWFEKAAEKGITGAMARLGQMYERGIGVKQDSRRAAKWYVLAANKGNHAARQRLRELGNPETGAEFQAPLEALSSLGELPALSALAEDAPTAKTAPPPKQEKRRRQSDGCGGILGGLNCAGR